MVNAAVRVGDRWLAGGALTRRAAVWSSTDGIAWGEPVLLEPELRANVDCDHHTISGFAPWNGVLLAIGWHGYGCGDGGDPMLWRSGDGVTWDVVDITGTAFAAEFPYPASTVAAPDGRLGVFASTQLGSVRALFLTSDLESWDAHTITDGAETESWIARLAASPTLLMGVGSIVIGEQPVETWTEEIYGPHVMTSEDGSTWTAIAPPAEEGTIEDIAWDGANGQFVAVGTDADGLPYAWLTTDGSQWTSIQLSDEPTVMRRVTAAEGLIVATGQTGTGAEAHPGDTVVWSSHDGANWWYGTVLEDRTGTVEAVGAGTAILFSYRNAESGLPSWLSLAGTVTTSE